MSGDGMPAHELDLVVGSMISISPEEDRAMFNEESSWVEDVQDLLREEGIEVDLTKAPGTEKWQGGIDTFADLYTLRRFAAHLERDNDLNSLNDAEEDIDPLLADIWEGAESTRYTHLINHQGEGGYYLPVEFDEPIWLSYEDEDMSDDWEDEEVVSFGSSVALARELADLEPLLQKAQGDQEQLQRALKALQVFRAAAEKSIEHQLPLILW